MMLLRWPSLVVMCPVAGLVRVSSAFDGNLNKYIPFSSFDDSFEDFKMRMSTNLRSADESTIVDVGSDAFSGSQRIDLRMETPAISSRQ
jgi:hypothetical protein